MSRSLLTSRQKEVNGRDRNEEEIPLTAYVMLKTIDLLNGAENTDITMALLAARKRGVPIGGINYFDTPRGPSSPEVKSELGLSLMTKEIEQLSPAILTDIGRRHMELLGNKIPPSIKEEIIQSIKSLQR